MYMVSFISFMITAGMYIPGYDFFSSDKKKVEFILFSSIFIFINSISLLFSNSFNLSTPITPISFRSFEKLFFVLASFRGNTDSNELSKSSIYSPIIGNAIYFLLDGIFLSG